MAAGGTRRDVLKGLAAVGATGLGSGVGITFGQSRAVSATTFPGAWEEAHRSILVPAFRKASDNAQVNMVASLAVDTVSKLVAAKANPPYDAVILDEGPFIAAVQHDIFEKLPPEKVPHLKDLPKKFVDPRGLGAYCSAQIIGIAYNTEKIKNPPKTWNDLLKPEYKGRVGLASMGSTLIAAWMVEIARINGGGEEHMEPAFQYLQKLLPNVGAVSASPGALATLFQQGQIDLAPHYSNNVGDLQGKGVPIAHQRPDTGWTFIRSTFHIVKNTKNLDLAAAYVNASLSPEVQSKMGDKPYLLVPTNTRVPFSPGLQQYAKDASELEKFHGVDWAKLNPRRAEYIDRFNREVKR
jgi:putative spermidine/putrescine transport system substrate-binding protein